MGEFPIVRAPEQLGVTPRTAVRADIDVRTGERAVGQAVGQAVLTAIELGMKWSAMEGKAQADIATRDARLSFVQMLNEIRQSPLDEQGQPIADDISRWDTAFQAHQERVVTLTPKNKRGARQYNQTINTLTPVWQERYNSLKAAKLDDNMIAASIVKVNDLLDSATIDNMALVATKIKTELEVRDRLSPSISRAATEIAKANVERDIQLSIARKMALSTPEATLERIEGDKMEGFDKLQPNDIINIRGIANSSITQAQIGIKQKDDAIGEELLALLINKLDPTKPQLTFDIIAASELSFDAKTRWESRLRTFDNYSEAELEEAFTDKGEVLADIYDKIDDGTLTDELDTMVGKGLSPLTAERIKKEIRTPYEKDSEQLFKRIFGWTPELGFETKMGGLLYEKTLREWEAEVKSQDAIGDKIIEIGRSIARPYFLEYLEAELPGDVRISRMIDLALGEEIEEEPEEPEVEEPEEIEVKEPELGETRTDDKGQTWEYIGDNKWRKM